MVTNRNIDDFFDSQIFLRRRAAVVGWPYGLLTRPVKGRVQALGHQELVPDRKKSLHKRFSLRIRLFAGLLASGTGYLAGGQLSPCF